MSVADWERALERAKRHGPIRLRWAARQRLRWQWVRGDERDQRRALAARAARLLLDAKAAQPR